MGLARIGKALEVTYAGGPSSAILYEATVGQASFFDATGCGMTPGTWQHPSLTKRWSFCGLIPLHWSLRTSLSQDEGLGLGQLKV